MNYGLLGIGIAAVFGLLLVGSMVYMANNPATDTDKQNKVYQGPVPEGYDEQQFRATGITKKIEGEVGK